MLLRQIKGFDVLGKISPQNFTYIIMIVLDRIAAAQEKKNPKFKCEALPVFDFA